MNQRRPNTRWDDRRKRSADSQVHPDLHIDAQIAEDMVEDRNDYDPAADSEKPGKQARNNAR